MIPPGPRMRFSGDKQKKSQ